MNYTIDILFGLDILVNFNLAYENEDFVTIDDRSKIAKEYLKGWFAIDFLAIVPFDIVLQFIASEDVS